MLQKKNIVFTAGVLLIALNITLSHYFKLPDFVLGAFFGVAIGCLIWTLKLHKQSLSKK